MIGQFWLFANHLLSCAQILTNMSSMWRPPTPHLSTFWHLKFCHEKRFFKKWAYVSIVKDGYRLPPSFFLPFFRSFAILLLAHFFPRAHWPKFWHRLGTHILAGSNSGLFFFYVTAPNWSNWGRWTTCSVTCGSGIRTRARRCDNPPPPPGGNVYCVGLPVETEGCTVRDCPSKPRCTVIYRFTQG